MAGFDTPTPHLFAHRGGPENGKYPENTLKAFKNASKVGYKFIETDVIATKDGHVVCYHGSLTWGDKRISGLEVRRKLQKLTYEEILKKAGSKSEEMPLLVDVLKRFPETCFSIDVKTKEAVEPTVEIIKRLKADGRVIITSFSLSRTLKANKLLRGKYKRAALCLSRISIWALPPFYMIFFPYIKRRGVKYLEVSYRRTTRTLVYFAHKYDMKVYSWTVNTEQSIRNMLRAGVDGVMSDEAELLIKVAGKKV